MPGELAAAADSCGPGTGGSCWAALRGYLLGLAMPFMVPLFCAGLSLSIYFVCCFVGCCRCCRRQMCCRERQEPKKATPTRVFVAVALWSAASACIAGLGVTVHELSLSTHLTLNMHLCIAARLASDAIGGRDLEEPRFLGSERGLYLLQDVSRALDVDGDIMRMVRRVVASTAVFDKHHEKLRRRIAHFTRVVSASGPAFRAFEHRCVFCSLAVGDPDNIITGYPPEGLLRQLSDEVGASAAEAMFYIRRYSESQLMGENLTKLASSVKRATGAMAVLDYALQNTLAAAWPQQMPSIDFAESLRVGYFLVQGMAAMGGAVLGFWAFFNTRVSQKRRPDTPIGGKLHCAAWCCGFCYATGALFTGGSLLLFAVSTGEACEFARLKILSESMIEHREALGLVALPPESDGLILEVGAASAASPTSREAAAVKAVSLAQTCFTENGTGDLLATMDLVKPFSFQKELTDAFMRLESVMTEPPAGGETREVLEKLRTTAVDFGDLFVLDPMMLGQTTGNTSSALGVLELSSNVEDLLLGSTLKAEDTYGPSGFDMLRGLNSYAALIAGPGKYTFAHGTAGGGFVITPDKPTEDDLQSLPAVVRNALLYGRAKEKMLTSNSSLNCDDLNDEGVSTKRHCGVKEFHEYVTSEVAKITAASTLVAQEAALVQGLFLVDLNVELLPTLRQVRDLRSIFDCRFLWPHVQDVHGSLCTELAPTVTRGAIQLLALAAAAVLGIVVQYKVWRHLKDNKVVAAEMARFEFALGRFEDQMAVITDTKDSKEARLKAYQSARMNMHADGHATGAQQVQDVGNH